ncbi:MAG: ribulose-phosphate 3-epimerase [Peptococcaceae bacterium]|nr:ribulose-phosphate 3-epimerase [Peptococcaceae bacterium]
MTKIKIAPSLLSADAACWGEEIKLIEEHGLKAIHLDIMDGHFVPNLTFGPGPVAMLRPLSSMEFDAHLMVEHPDSLIPAFLKAGTDSITVHAEACVHIHRTLQSIRDGGAKAGVAINPGTPWQCIEPVLEFCDRVLVMTVNPGFGGQKAILPVLRKVSELKALRQEKGLGFELQTDGGITRENLGAFLSAGAENLVIGSALFQKGKTAENIKAFAEIIAAEEARG